MISSQLSGESKLAYSKLRFFDNSPKEFLIFSIS